VYFEETKEEQLIVLDTVCDYINSKLIGQFNREKAFNLSI